jgi:predicted secreted protein
MNWYTALIAFTIIWWLVLFMVLPFGVRTAADERIEVEPGHASSAPILPHIGRKFLITTGIALAVMGVYWAVVTYDPFGLGEWLRVAA